MKCSDASWTPVQEYEIFPFFVKHLKWRFHFRRSSKTLAEWQILWEAVEKKRLADFAMQNLFWRRSFFEGEPFLKEEVPQLGLPLKTGGIHQLPGAHAGQISHHVIQAVLGWIEIQIIVSNSWSPLASLFSQHQNGFNGSDGSIDWMDQWIGGIQWVKWIG